jgi:hypothetical protein
MADTPPVGQSGRVGGDGGSAEAPTGVDQAGGVCSGVVGV